MLKHIHQILTNQRGGFSPYMYGMLLGITTISMVTAHHAKQRVLDEEQRKIEQQRLEAEDLRQGLSLALATETAATYDNELTLDRAREFSTMATGRTRGGNTVTFDVVSGSTGAAFEVTRQTVVISTSDDTMLTDTIASQNTRDAQLDFNQDSDAAIAVFDADAERAKQMAISRENLEMEGAQVYMFYSGNLRFPDASEYSDINNRTGYTDFWGNNFTYNIIDSTTHVTLSYTTPWGYTDSVDLNF